MAVKAKKTKEIKAETIPAIKEETRIEKDETKKSRWTSVAFVLLLFGGLAHMLPGQMAPVLSWGLFGVTLQMAIGVLSVILALNFLLED